MTDPVDDIIAAARAIQETVLEVQGPPGAGSKWDLPYLTHIKSQAAWIERRALEVKGVEQG